jgi:hypothetical protein
MCNVVDILHISFQTFALSAQVLRRGGQAIQVGLLGGMLQMPLVMFPLKALKVSRCDRT